MRERQQQPAKATNDDWENSVCAKCPALCCTYITIEIDEPADEQDLDNLRWYLIHDGITVLVENQRWFVKTKTPCVHLQSDYRCAIYPKRPEACQRYETESCDYRIQSEGLAPAYREFADFERLRRYVQGRWARARRGRKKQRPNR
jgi:Fe-S-cluster containining protein